MDDPAFDSDQPLTIVEGEIDKLAVETAGNPFVVSVPEVGVRVQHFSPNHMGPGERGESTCPNCSDGRKKKSAKCLQVIVDEDRR
jgi:hypothetical protein